MTHIKLCLESPPRTLADVSSDLLLEVLHRLPAGHPARNAVFVALARRGLDPLARPTTTSRRAAA